MGTTGAILEEEPEQASAPAARHFSHRPGAARPGAGKPSTLHLQRYFELLGLKGGASLDAINTAYYMQVKRFPENPTEEDEARLQEIKRAYEMLKRVHVPPRKKAIKVILSRRLLIPFMSVLIVLALGGLVAFNWGAIKLSMTHYEPGAVLKLKGQGQPYGEVTGFDPRHRWDTGNPSPAYSIRLQGSQDVVWVGEHLVVNGMIPVK
jgi:hypothetical protein